MRASVALVAPVRGSMEAGDTKTGRLPSAASRNRGSPPKLRSRRLPTSRFQEWLPSTPKLTFPMLDDQPRLARHECGAS